MTRHYDDFNDFGERDRLKARVKLSKLGLYDYEKPEELFECFDAKNWAELAELQKTNDKVNALVKALGGPHAYTIWHALRLKEGIDEEKSASSN